jgi:hypothetical protein
LIVWSTRARNVFAQNAYNPRVELRVRAKAEDLLERLAVTSRYASMMAQPMNSTPLPPRCQSVQAKANAAADVLAGASISGKTSLIPVSRRELQARVTERFHG